jgi:hypothetical protein
MLQARRPKIWPSVRPGAHTGRFSCHSDADRANQSVVVSARLGPEACWNVARPVDCVWRPGWRQKWSGGVSLRTPTPSAGFFFLFIRISSMRPVSLSWLCRPRDQYVCARLPSTSHVHKVLAIAVTRNSKQCSEVAAFVASRTVWRYSNAPQGGRQPTAPSPSRLLSLSFLRSG